MATTALGALIQPATTPGWLRLQGLVVVALVGLFGVLATREALVAQSATEVIEENTAPSLVAIQDVFAGAAEANAAATGAFVSATSGEETRLQRNLYLDAVGRAAAEVETVARLVGDAPVAHAALADLSVDLVTYSGRIEASRTANLIGSETSESSDATSDLIAALDIGGRKVAASVDTITAAGREQLDDQTARFRWGRWVAMFVGVAGLAALVRFHQQLATRTRRIANLPIVLATVLLVAAMATLLTSIGASRSALTNARRGGFDSITSTADIQANAYALHTDLTLSLLGAGDPDVPARSDAVAAGIDRAQAAADSRREQAATTELGIRWERYRNEVEAIEGDAARRDAAALERLEGEGFSTFTGLNTSIESVLSDNRTQFTGGVTDARRAVSQLPLLMVVLPTLAAAATLFGISRRLREYR